MTSHVGALPRRMAVAEFQTTLPSVQDHVGPALDQIRCWMRRHDLDDEVVGDVELALAEALNNVIEHGYAFRQDGTISVSIMVSSDRVTSRIVDCGRVFKSPVSASLPDVQSLPLEDIPEGGFGWGIINSLMDVVEVARIGDENHMTLRRNLSTVLPVA